jgi:hypothetical protein
VQSLQSYEVDDQLAATASTTTTSQHTHHLQHHHHQSKQLHDHTPAAAAAATDTTTAATSGKVSCICALFVCQLSSLLRKGLNNTGTIALAALALRILCAWF